MNTQKKLLNISSTIYRLSLSLSYDLRTQFLGEDYIISEGKQVDRCVSLISIATNKGTSDKTLHIGRSYSNEWIRVRVREREFMIEMLQVIAQELGAY